MSLPARDPVSAEAEKVGIDLGPPWPDVDNAIRYGLVGDVLRLLEPHSEADPVGLAADFLAAFGNAVGIGPYVIADGAVHPPRINVCLVGKTARSRKGTVRANVGRIFEDAAPNWASSRVMTGLSTGEGLIAQLRDSANPEEKVDKRLLAYEPEFARVLKAAGRQNSTLSDVIRDLWDRNQGRVMTRGNPLEATNAHLTIIAHTTGEELRQTLTDTDIANGFANRFLFLLVRRSKKLPRGGQADQRQRRELATVVATRLAEACKVGEMHRSAEADALWDDIYEQIDDDADGMFGAITARAEAQILRLSIIYALTDGSSVIEWQHLKAAESFWRYAADSACYLFGEEVSNPAAAKLLNGIRLAGKAGLDAAGQYRLFSGHIKARELADARTYLQDLGTIVTQYERTEGRPRFRSFLASFASLSEKAQT